MALYSMTGFGRGVAEGDNYTVTTEIKSVNHRFKDVRFKMSSLFNSAEIELKKILFSKVKRGTFEVYINYKKSDQVSHFDDLDGAKIKDFLEKLKDIVGEDKPLTIHPIDFLRSEFYRDNDLSQDPELSRLATISFQSALKELMESRNEEGEKLKAVILGHKEEYEKSFSLIKAQSEVLQSEVEAKLRKRFEEYKDEIKADEPRFMQEVVFYLEKLDIHEEINRITTHLEKLDSLIKKGGELGRQIDFLMQELNRETNTIGSKSASEEISSSVVQMKVQLEKIREQGLNLE